MLRDKLRLPVYLSAETCEALSAVFSRIGSICKCTTTDDFGRYRFVLVKEFDDIIRRLKKEKEEKCN